MKYKLKPWWEIKELLFWPMVLVLAIPIIVTAAHMIMVIADVFVPMDSATNAERWFGWVAWAISLPIGLFLVFFEKEQG